MVGADPVQNVRAGIPSMRDFFISYNSADRIYAEGIRGWLEAAGHSSIMQASDFHPGSNFVLEMHEACKAARRMIAVMSPDYLSSRFTAPEWAAMFAKDPTGANRLLIPVRIRVCEIQGLLKQIVYIDLVGLGETEARKKLLDGIVGNPLVYAPRKPKSQSSTKPREKKSTLTQTATGNRNIQVGGDFNYNPVSKVKHVIEPGPAEISQTQRAELLERLNKLGERDELAGRGATYGNWMRCESLRAHSKSNHTNC